MFDITKAFDFPTLAIDGVIYEDKPLPLRQRIERQVVWDLCAHLLKAGFEPVLVDDGESRTKVPTVKAAMELLFNLDEATLRFRKTSEPGRAKECVFFVFGNDGWDCAADMSCGREDWDKAISSFDFERYEGIR